MPIPELNENNFFPLGEHIVTREEIHERFVFNEQRQVMWNRFLPFMQYIIAMNCFREMLLFGSYFSDKADPSDIDVALRFRTEDFAANVDVLLFNKQHFKDTFDVDVCILQPLNEAYLATAPEGYKFHSRNLHFATLLKKQEAFEIGMRTKIPQYDYTSKPAKGILKIVLE